MCLWKKSVRESCERRRIVLDYTDRLILLTVPLALILNGCGIIRPTLSVATCVASFGRLELPESQSGITPTNRAGHYIVTNRAGKPANERGDRLHDDDFKTGYIEKIREGFSKYVKHVTLKYPDGPARLLFFVHGGLNSFDESFDRIESLTYKDKDTDFHLFAHTKSKNETRSEDKYRSLYYPVFVVWDATFSSAVCDDIYRVRAGSEEPGWAVPTSFFALARRGGESISGSLHSLGSMALDLAEGFDSKEALPQNIAINAPLFPIRFITAPLIRAFGNPAWQMLYRRTDVIVHRKRFSTEYNKANTDGAVVLLMKTLLCSETEKNHAQNKPSVSCLKVKDVKVDDKLETQLVWVDNENDKENNPKEIKLEITLVGHSMGTLILDSFTQSFPQIPLRRIVYLASASSIEDVELSIIPYLTRNQKSEFYAYTLSRGNEARELQGWGSLPQGSLLVWIDSFLADIYTPGQFRFGRRKNLDQVGLIMPEDVKKRVYLGTFEGKTGEPTQHGHFDEPDKLPRVLCNIDTDAFLETPANANFEGLRYFHCDNCSAGQPTWRQCEKQKIES